MVGKGDTIYIIYDDECPFCRSYCQLVRLRDAVGRVELVDARQPSVLMDEVTALGLDIDRGMVVKVGEQVFYGADAIHKLALLSTRSGLFNRLTYWMFQSKAVTSVLYPFLRDCRNLALWLMGVPMIKNLEKRCSKP